LGIEKQEIESRLITSVVCWSVVTLPATETNSAICQHNNLFHSSPMYRRHAYVRRCRSHFYDGNCVRSIKNV